MQRAQEAGCFTWRWADKVPYEAVNAMRSNESKSKERRRERGEEE